MKQGYTSIYSAGTYTKKDLKHASIDFNVTLIEMSAVTANIFYKKQLSLFKQKYVKNAIKTHKK